MDQPVATRRAELLQDMVGVPIPRLWCPPVTHYVDDGSVDIARMAAHWRSMSAYVGGFLVPGSTGEGWDMAEAEVDALVDLAIGLAVGLDTRLLIGVLQVDAETMIRRVDAIVADLRARTGLHNPFQALKACHVVGFTICPPRGAALTQDQIRDALAQVLDLGIPIALYQLPQITQNEVSAATFADLATRYPNLIMFKDTSGQDRVPLSDGGASGVFLVRGAERDYAKWLDATGGCYHGFLLSTANGFARELREVIDLAVSGQVEAAQRLSRRLTAAVDACFDAVSDLPYGNPFASANKAIYHHMAYGARAVDMAAPLLHSTRRLPEGVVRTIGEILREHSLVPPIGYLS